MDELIKNLPHSELKFIEDNREQAEHYYNIVKQVKQNEQNVLPKYAKNRL